LKQVGDQTNQQIAATTEERDQLQRQLEEAKAETKVAEERANTSAKPSLSNSRGAAVASFVLSPSLRGSGQLQRLSIPQNIGKVAMRLTLEPNNFDAYSAVLKDPDSGQIIWQSGRLKASGRSGSSSLNFSIPARLLASKIYTISLTGFVGAREPESFSDYTFQIVR
ncbi:MAG TPA: hypothetical protein VEV84_03650, partial [Pyrinomonadaceae bacterium]|nr:hypothetical protein [Pyrinomonadaceae bacterium]